jgi:hypothetical protein
MAFKLEGQEGGLLLIATSFSSLMFRGYPGNAVCMCIPKKNSIE